MIPKAIIPRVIILKAIIPKAIISKAMFCSRDSEVQLLTMLGRQRQVLSSAIVTVLLLIYAVLQGCFIWPWLMTAHSITSFAQTSWTWLRAAKDPSLPWVIALLQVGSAP